MKVHWLTRYGWEGASSRYRVLQYIEQLRAAGITSTTAALTTWSGSRANQLAGVAARLRALHHLPRDADAIVVQKEAIMPPLCWPLARRPLRGHRVPMIWDVDDAVWLGRAGSERMATDLARAATVVVAGNGLIAEWARSAGADDVRVIPTCYQPAAEPPVHRSPEPTAIRFVWIGSPSTAPLLDEAAPLLHSLQERFPIELTVVGAQPREALRSVDTDYLQWSPEHEHQALSGAHYGLALQPRTEYADHKCGLKVVQYLSYGVVPVATDSPVHRDLVGKVGILMDHRVPTEEILDALALPPSDADRNRARRRWQDVFSRRAGADAWQSLLDEVAS